MIDFPHRITAGDSFTLPVNELTINGSRYGGDKYALKIILRGCDGSIDLNAEPNGSGWIVKLGSSASTKLGGGVVKWVAYLSYEDERITAQQGILKVDDDLSAASSFDARTKAQIALEAAEKALATFTASGGKVKKYVIANRQMEFETSAEIMVAINYWKLKVANEQGRNRDLYLRWTNGV